MMVRPAILHEKAREAIRSFPPEVREKLGFLIFELQAGKAISMPQSRPMPEVGRGVSELRVKNARGQYRAFYVVVTERGVLVFHAFGKKTQKTPKAEIELGKKRLREMLT